MVSLIWWILSLFDVCEFTWMPVFIDGCITAVNPGNFLDDSDSQLINIPIGIGVALFAACKLWLSLSISGWWCLLSTVWFFVAFFLPGGFTLTNYLFGHFGLMTVPTWVFITGIVVDAIILIGMIWFFIADRLDRS